MTAVIVVNKEQLARAKKKLAAARDAVRNSETSFRQIAVLLDQWVQANFKTKGGKVGGWAGYTYGGRLVRKSKSNAQSIDGKHYIDGSAQLLQNTGHLRLSFLPFARVGVAGIGSDLPYSRIHDEGDGIVRRRLLPNEADIKDRARKILTDFIVVRVDHA